MSDFLIWVVLLIGGIIHSIVADPIGSSVAVLKAMRIPLAGVLVLWLISQLRLNRLRRRRREMELRVCLACGQRFGVASANCPACGWSAG